MRTQLPFALLAVALACAQFTSAAHAAPRDRVFVASYGDDANPCTFLSPCKTFQNAYNTVAAGGEITAIDSAGFGPLTITKSVTITSPPGVEAGIVPTSGGDAITISATSDIDVTLRGLTLEGSTGGNHGIFLTSTVLSATLNILDCVVKDFTAGGIVIEPTSRGSTHGLLNLLISNTYSLNNGLDGINLDPTGKAVVGGMIYQTTAANNQGIGFNISLSNITISNSVAVSNGNVGMSVQGAAGLTLRDSVSQNNAGSNGDLYANGGSVLLFHNNTIDFLTISNFGNVTSDGTNDIGFISGGTLLKQGLQ